ncbi:unnamed protein product [Protopolystoma xenopodis]|uniref:Uncharacterized protein n=1 Tax=Protopolystoma xenopodis TaxID=117903 RepID=A0A3S5AB27_9PLAT|nr:unnamed protein product [Protopolystoma xenopodis]
MPVFCSSVVSSDAASTDDLQSELVRHYLIEAISSPPRGVRLKGFASEPIFPSLVSLIHQHTHAPLALPCRLLLPEPVAGQMPTPGYQTLPAIVMGPSQANANVDALETDVGMAEAGNFGCLEPEIRPQARQRGLPSAVSSSASETFNYYHQMQQQHQQQYQTGQHHYQHPVQAHLQHQQTETGMEVAGGGMSAGLTPRVTSPMPPVSSMISPMSPISPTPGMFQSSGPGISESSIRTRNSLNGSIFMCESAQYS